MLGITHRFGENSSEVSQSQRGTCRVGRIKIFSFSPQAGSCFYYLLSPSASHYGQDFEETDFTGLLSPDLKGRGGRVLTADWRLEAGGCGVGYGVGGPVC